MKLHDYQLRAVDHLLDNPRAGLFMEMGLGKTAVVLHALQEKHMPALVIAPKRVAENVWPAELEKWGLDWSMALAIGDPVARDLALHSKADITVIGRDNQADIAPGRYRTFILDELSYYKGRGTRWKEAKRFCTKAEYVWGLTGTPSPNGLMDLWAQLYLLDRGERLGKYITHYRERYFTVGKRHPQFNVVIRWDPKPEAEKRILEKIDDICLSMKSKDYLDLPPVTVNTVHVPLPAKVARLYEKFEETLVADMEELLGVPHTAANAAILTNKLSQVLAGFLYDDDHDSFTELHRERTRVVQEIVDGTGSPVLVFYQFLPERDALLELDGARSIDEKNVIRDWNAGRIPVLVAHPAAAGHGLNLQEGGHTEIWSSLTWSLEHYDQGVGRLDRQGQKHPVMVHHLVTPGTVDEAKQARLVEKKSVQDAVMEYLARRRGRTFTS